MPKPPPLPAALVQEFVTVAHSHLARTRELLDQEPELLNASWDWGGGDWETALGAAAHMGKRDIAMYLLGRGARMDIFAAAMLGHVAVVEAMLDAQPETIDSRGPHNITLMSHAKKGGKAALSVVKLLKARSEAGRRGVA